MFLSKVSIQDLEVLTPNGWSDFQGIGRKETVCIFKITLSDRSTIECTDSHNIKYPNGDYLEACHIQLGDELYGGLIVEDIDVIEEDTLVYDLLDVELGNEYYTNNVVSKNCAFIPMIDEIWSSAKSTLSTGGSCIALSTPYNVGNWFHKTWVAAENGENQFLPIRLPWYVHPDRDEEWRKKEDIALGEKIAARENDCDFETSGDTFIQDDVIKWIEETTIQEPMEKIGINHGYWIWEYPDSSKDYMIVADVARGDGSDYSTFHIIDIGLNVQVAEFKDMLPPHEFAKVLVSKGYEYNTALMIIDSTGVGWSCVEKVMELEYKNLYYSIRGNVNDAQEYIKKSESSDKVAGFNINTYNRPLLLNKLSEHLREKTLRIQSKRTLEELKVFIWKNGKAEAQRGYNDDLVMPMGMAMYLRDTALRFKNLNEDLSVAVLDNMKKVTTQQPMGVRTNGANTNPYRMSIGGGKSEDISWLFRRK